MTIAQSLKEFKDNPYNNNHPFIREVLDHGYITLVDFMGSDADIVRAARVSYNADDKTGEDTTKDNRLLARLWRDRHTSPFESVELKFEIQAPIFVIRQWMRHRTWSYNEISGRYTELPELYYTPEPEIIGKQSQENKQGRTLDELGFVAGLDGYRKLCDSQFNLYRALLREGWPRELARGVLPLCTYSRFIGKVDLRNLLHFLSLRTDPHAQYEIRVYAEAIEEILKEVVPETMKLYESSS